MLVPGFCIAPPHFIRELLRVLRPQAVDYDMGMDISRMIAPVRVRTYDSLMPWEVFPGIFHAHLLRLLYRQTQLCIFRIVTDDVMMGFNIPLRLIFLKGLVQFPAFHRKGIRRTEQAVDQIFFSDDCIALFVKYLSAGLFIMLKNQIAVCSIIVCIFL